MRNALFLRLLIGWPLLFQTSCVGLTIVAGTKRVDSGPSIGKEIGDNGYSWGGRTKAEVIKTWGPPKRKFFKEGRQYWVYKKGLTWRGVVAWAIIPVPLMVPVGQHKTRLQFQEDTLRSYTTTYGIETSFGYFCGDNACEFMNGKESTGDGW